LDAIDVIESRARELLKSGSADRMEVYYLVESLFTELSNMIRSKHSREAARRGAWNVELLDNAVEDVVDALGGSYDALDLWESAWELRTGSGDTLKTLEKLINVIELVKRRRGRLTKHESRRRRR